MELDKLYFGLEEDKWKAELDNDNRDVAQANIMRLYIEHNRETPDQSDLSTSYELQRVLREFEKQWEIHPLKDRHPKRYEEDYD